jgi:hypothetical protein
MRLASGDHRRAVRRYIIIYIYIYRETEMREREGYIDRAFVVYILYRSEKERRRLNILYTHTHTRARGVEVGGDGGRDIKLTGFDK